MVGMELTNYFWKLLAAAAARFSAIQSEQNRVSVSAAAALDVIFSQPNPLVSQNVICLL